MDRTRRTRALKTGRIGRRLRADGGFAIPTVMLMMLAAFAVVSVGVVTTVNVQRGTVRDEGTKSAVQLAQTGVNEAMLHFNRIAPSLTNRCSPVSSTLPDASGWCAPITRTDAAGGSYTWQIRTCDWTGVCPPATGRPPYLLEMVGVGTIGGVTRRVDVQAHSASGNPIFGDAQVKAGDGITLDSNARIHAGTATNGDITLNANAKQCGLASVGVGHEMRTASSNSYFSDPNCTSPATTVGEKQIDLPPVSQGDANQDGHNANGNFFAHAPVSGSLGNACWNGFKADGSTGTCGPRQLDLKSNTAVTLEGGTYSLCKLTMSSNTSLFVAANQDAVIYFDDPENCGFTEADEPVVQLQMASNTRISSNSGSPVQLLFVGGQGSMHLATSLHLSSNTDINASCVQNFIVYAPLSDIDLNSNSTYCGALAAKTLHLDSNADVRTSDASSGFIVPNVAPHYKVDRFVDCVAVTASPPNAGC